MKPTNGWLVKIGGGKTVRLFQVEGGYIALTSDGKRYQVAGTGTVEQAADAINKKLGGVDRPSGQPTGPPLPGTDFIPTDRGYPGMPIVKSITPDYSLGDYGRGAATGGAIGAGMGALMGGPVGAGTGAAGGGLGEVASMALEEAGFSGGAQFGGSAAADIGMSMLTRRPTAGLVRRVPWLSEATEAGIEHLGKGGAIKRFLGRNWAAESTGLAERQAGKLITDLPSPSPAGTNPAIDVAETVRSGHQMMEDAYQGARRQAEKETMGMYGRAEPLIRKSQELLEDFKHLDETPKVLRNAAKLPSEITLREAENIRKGVGTAWAKSQLPAGQGQIPHYSRMGELYEPLDEVLDDIAAHSEVGERSVTGVQAMRDAASQMHKALPESSATYQYLVGKGRMDNAQKALDRILSSDQAVAEVKRLRSMMTGVGDDLALQRAAVIHVLQRRLGEQADSVASSAQSGSFSALGRRASAESAALTEILGERGFKQLEDVIAMADSGKGGSKRGWMASRVLLYLAGAAYGQNLGPAASTAVLALGSVVEAFLRQNGKEGLGKLAIAALTDPEIHALVMRGANVNNAEAAAVRLGQALVRRGLFTADELGGDG